MTNASYLKLSTAVAGASDTLLRTIEQAEILGAVAKDYLQMNEVALRRTYTINLQPRLQQRVLERSNDCVRTVCKHFYPEGIDDLAGEELRLNTLRDNSF